MIVANSVDVNYLLSRNVLSLAELDFKLNPEKAERWKQISSEAGELYFRKKREERWSYLDTRNTLRHTAFMRNMRMMIRGWCEDEFKKG